MTQLLRDTALLTIGLMPHGTLGFEQTFVCIEVFRGKARIELFSIVAQKRDEISHGVVEGFIAPCKRGAMGHCVESKDLWRLGMLP
jgi:hypothetical protein